MIKTRLSFNFIKIFLDNFIFYLYLDRTFSTVYLDFIWTVKKCCFSAGRRKPTENLFFFFWCYRGIYHAISFLKFAKLRNLENNRFLFTERCFEQCQRNYLAPPLPENFLAKLLRRVI